MKSIKERGLYKENIKSILFRNENVMRVLFDDYDNLNAKQRMIAFKNNVKSHLFIDDTLEDKESFIFFDVVIPNLAPQIKTCKIVLFTICHRELLDDYYFDGYYGNRADILSEVVEEALCNPDNAKQFGIGELTLEGVDIYNTDNYYGVNLIFKAECFR